MNVVWQEGKDPQDYPTLEFIAESEAQRKITGCLWIPNGTVQPGMLMAFGHGASGDRYQMPIPHLARRLAKEGVASLSMDGPVHGLRQQAEGGRAALQDEMRRRTMIEDMVGDWQASVAIAESRLGFSASKFGYFGLSMGSIFGIPYLAHRVRNGQPVTAATLGLLGTSGAVVALAQRLREAAAMIETPLLFLVQLEDELFPREGCFDLFDSFKSNDKRMHANPGLHPEVPAEEIDFSFSFLCSRLLQD